MTVGQLKEALQDVPDDMPVRVWTDHGQHSMPVNSTGYFFALAKEREKSMIDRTMEEQELEDYGLETDEVFKFFEIASG